MTRDAAVDAQLLDRAHQALVRLYGDWETNGGPSPSTRDEALFVAEALGVEPIVDEEVLHTIWLSREGAELEDLALAHLTALRDR